MRSRRPDIRALIIVSERPELRFGDFYITHSAQWRDFSTRKCCEERTGEDDDDDADIVHRR